MIQKNSANQKIMVCIERTLYKYKIVISISTLFVIYARVFYRKTELVWGYKLFRNCYLLKSNKVYVYDINSFDYRT